MSRGYIKVSVGPGLNLRPSISFVDRTRIEADGQQLTKDAEQKFTMILSKKVFAPKKEYWEDEDFSIGQDGMFYDNKYTEDGQE